MAKYNGLIIPRSYNDYYSRSDPQAIKDIVKVYTDKNLDINSENPVQNKTIAELIPAGATAENKLTTQDDLNIINDMLPDGASATDQLVKSSELKTVKDLIPAEASTTNELADKDFVNSTVGTNTSIFRGTFNSLAELQAYSGAKTNNDYAFVIGQDSAGNTEYNRYKYNGSSWEYEYTLNNSSFTAEQWAAINSGATATLIQQLSQIATIDAIFNAIHPVGEIYVQYPQQKTPRELYGRGTWTEVNYDGAFFRANGGNASVFNSGKQAEGLPNITGDNTFTGTEYGLFWENATVKGAFQLGTLLKVGRPGVATGNSRSMKFDASKGETTTNGTVRSTALVYGKSDHVTPENHTIKIWKRTA